MGNNYNLEELYAFGVQPLAQWLIEAALLRESITYSQAKYRLEAMGFPTVFSTHMGKLAGTMMDEIQEVFPDVPLLNVMLIRQDIKVPGEGARYYLSDRFKKPELERKDIIETEPELWREYYEKAATEVMAFSDWPDVYRGVFGKSFIPSQFKKELAELPLAKDGEFYGGRESQEHKNLKQWVKENPACIMQYQGEARTATEVILKSADRVDVVIYARNKTIAVEVKSRRSGEADLERGIYQCIKYRAVLEAMDPRTNPQVFTVLVTESDLPGYLKEIARHNDIKHKKIEALL